MGFLRLHLEYRGFSSEDKVFNIEKWGEAKQAMCLGREKE